MRMRQLAVVGLLALSACGNTDRAQLATDESRQSSVPEEFREACGKPGSTVTTERSAVTVKHADCDLTGVTISRNGWGGASVPAIGEGVGSSSGLSITRSANGDVSFRVQGEPQPPAQPGVGYG